MISDLEKEAKEKMSKTVTVYREQLDTIRAGRANPRLLDKITVDYYGQATPINQVANVSAPEARMILIQPFDSNQIGAIEKSILISDLGLNPSNDGKVIRLIIPQLTEERRVELSKVVKKEAENSKVAIRNVRRDINDQIKKMEKDKELTEDEKKKAEETIQKITDSYIEDVDKITKEKEEELMEI
ncbi:MAG: ribosome recycling factor [Tissierellia bacterium]|nr:ribosome recycling factor [Tissierellia bacterium]